MNTPASPDPFDTLGVSPHAGEEEVRARYLELVKRFPPEREPERFRAIRAAYEAAGDPLTLASRLIAPPGEDPPQWMSVIEQHKRIRPVLTPQFLLSLGNRAPGDQPPNFGDPSGPVEATHDAEPALSHE